MRVLIAAVLAVPIAVAIATPAHAERWCGGLVDAGCEWWDGSGDDCAVFVNPRRLGVDAGAYCVFEQTS